MIICTYKTNICYIRVPCELFREFYFLSLRYDMVQRYRTISIGSIRRIALLKCTLFNWKCINYTIIKSDCVQRIKEWMLQRNILQSNYYGNI